MLSDHEFSDIYLGQVYSFLSGVPHTKDPIPAPDDCQEDLKALRQLCEEGLKENVDGEFRIRHRERCYRVSLLESIEEVVFVLRRGPAEIRRLDQLGIHDGHTSILLQSGLTGLLIIAGPFGQGKTTTASSLIVARLEKDGGVAVTLEQPPELPLQGRHGDGVCYQTWVRRGGLAEACRQAARWAPSIIFVGEVRDSETAKEAISAAINGRLVICTIHSDNVVSAIERMFTFANGNAGTSDDVAGLLANGLAGVLHQQLVGEPKTPRVEFLWFKHKDDDGPRAKVADRNFKQLNSDVDLQLRQLRRGGNGGRG